MERIWLFDPDDGMGTVWIGEDPETDGAEEYIKIERYKELESKIQSLTEQLEKERKRVIVLERAIKNALNIKQLWYSEHYGGPEYYDEQKALNSMHETFIRAINPPEPTQTFGNTHLCEHRKVESVCDICKKDGE